MIEGSYRLPELFETTRYILRRVKVSDAQLIFDGYAKDPKVTRFLGWKPHSSNVDTTAFLNIATAEWDRGTGFPVIAFHRERPNELIGMFHPHLMGHQVTYGYVLRATAWGQGAASEIMTWLVDHALSHPEIFRVEAFCDVENRASARVMEKAGMTFEGVLRRYFLHPNISDTPRDCMMYAKVR